MKKSLRKKENKNKLTIIEFNTPVVIKKLNDLINSEFDRKTIGRELKIVVSDVMRILFIRFEIFPYTVFTGASLI